jgi:hypothetical protein
MELIGSLEGNKRGHKAATRRDLKREERAWMHEDKETKSKEGGAEERRPRTAEDDDGEARERK